MKKGLKRLLAVLTAAVVAVVCATDAFAANENGKDGEKTKASQTEILPSTLLKRSLSLSENEKPPAPQAAKGDVSGDGIVDIEDAMLVFCGINVLPVDVANWLYKNTEEFCRTFSGSSGSAIRLAAEHYGAETTNIYEYSDLLAAFENNGTVCIAVGKGIFCNNGTHCIFLYGYDAESGKVNAADPWTRKMNGSYDLAEIWAERSTSPVDLRFDGCVAYGIR